MLRFLSCLAIVLSAGKARGADHGDAPGIAHDQGADIADAFLFLDPNDNTKVVMAMTFHGFIVPGEAVNFGIFDPNIRYRFEIENTGDEKPDLFIHVLFSKRVSTAEAQIATVTIRPSGRSRTNSFMAPATNPSLAAAPNPPVLTTDAVTGITFFAGEVDDPFFFDIPAFGRFVASVRAGAPNPALLSRGRDSFAGYNILTIALRIPVALVRGKSTGVVGLDVVTQRRVQVPTRRGEYRTHGDFFNVDRTGNPAVNVALIPFAHKNLHNASDTRADARGEFEADILSTLSLFGTDDTSKNIFQEVVVRRGDFLRLDLDKPNSGPGGGNNPEAAFPNGRRPGDDTIDTLLFLINNRSPLGDNVNGNDVPLRSEFPFFAPPQQPRDPGIADDNTRN
jgi:hypothetical protein